MRVFACAMTALSVLVVSVTATTIATPHAEARCKTCKKAPVVRWTYSRTKEVRRPVRKVVKHTRSYQTKRVRYVRTVKVVTHIIPTYRVKKVRTVYLQKIVSYDKRRFHKSAPTSNTKARRKRAARAGYKRKWQARRSGARTKKGRKLTKQHRARYRMVTSRVSPARFKRRSYRTWPGDR